MKRIVILISGRGSNLEALVRSCAEEKWPAQVVAVIANRADAAGLQFAQMHGITAVCVPHRDFGSRQGFDAALAEAVQSFAPDLVLLAGFMRILGTAFVHKFEGRMLNIHPSLLPAFPGLHTHRRALHAGCQVSGASVHLVTPELDHGPILMQSVVPVLPGDDETSLARRVLATEHVIYPTCVRWMLQGKLALKDGRMVHREGASQVWI